MKSHNQARARRNIFARAEAEKKERMRHPTGKSKYAQKLKALR